MMDNFRNITQSDLLVGGDPEFFLYDTKTEEYVSAHDLLPGTKEEPFPMEYGCVQVDGTAVEFNIDPASTEDNFVNNVKNTIGCIREMVEPRFEFIYRAAIQYNSPYFKKLPQSAIRLGCNPDYSGYTFTHNPLPEPPRISPTLRTASGHVTVGWHKTLLDDHDVNDFQNIVMCGRIARNLDITLGLPSLSIDRDRTRRILYGKAGAFRPKPFGIEYRVLSNYWLQNEKHMRSVYCGAVKGVLDFFNNSPNCLFMSYRQDEVVNQINGGQ